MAAHQLTSPRFAISGVPVFMYHDLCAARASDERYTTALPVFSQHLSFLREQQFAARDLSALDVTSNGRSVILTFDDGLVSHYDLAFPALLEHALTATFFVTTSLVESPGYVTWSQLREMSAAGMTIGSHGREHIDYTGLPPVSAEGELRSSRMALEDHLGKPASSFSAPYGFLNDSLTRAAQRAGFRWICSSHPWPADGGTVVIPRLAIYCDTDLARFSALAAGSAFPLLARRARNALLHLPKQLLLRTSPRRLGVHVSQEIK
jgi:peptidoglycan/xylan/chitin deacetylase (PgdA/CDA1 family)